MPGDPEECRLNAAPCLALSEGAPEARQAFIELAATWRKLAAETESDEALFRAICEMDLVEPYEALPHVLTIRSWSA